MRMRACCPSKKRILLVLAVYSLLYIPSIVFARDFIFHVQEEQPAGAFVGTLPVVNNVVYSFEQSYSNFVLNKGDVTTSNTLDRENLASNPISLIVKTTNPAEPHVTVKVVVDDINDNPPRFPKSLFDLHISEAVGLGAKFSLDAAKDKDAGENGTVTYKIISGNSAGKFQLGTDGSCTHSPLCLIVIGNLDRETRDFYSLNISAEDGGIQPLETFCLVQVSVLDTNDHSPQFLNSSYVGYIAENSNLSTSILTVKALDVDAGTNAAIKYFIQGDSDNVFQIGEQSGVIKTRGILDFEVKQTYTFQAVATDLGSPPRENKVSVTIHVIDLNEHAPIINVIYLPNTKPPELISEGATPGTQVAIVSVSDGDNMNSGKVKLEFVKGNELGHFTLTSLTPKLFIIVVSGELDREKVAVYDLILRASDDGSPVQSSEHKLIVALQDINDEAPTFSVPLYTTSVNEQEQIGSFVFSLNASDTDSGDNAKISYSIVDGNDYGWFTVDPVLGLVTTAKSLDRENTTQVTLNIMAKDHGQPVLNGTVQLTVHILDANDNSPIFNHSVYNKTIPENNVAGSTIFQLAATDKDTGKNGQVRYAIDSSLSSIADYFTITNYSGILKTKVRLDREAMSSYDIQVIAKDSGNPQLSARATVHLTLEDVNDNDPKFYPLVYIVSLMEKEPAKHLDRVTATDPDIGINGEILYSIVTGNDSGEFSINRTSGIVSTVKPLNHSVKGFYKLEIRATDGGGRTAQQLATVDITVLRNSDNPPQFQHSIYNFSIYENTPKGTVVGLVRATTKDNANVTYSIISGDPDGLFTVDAFGGIVTVDGAIDRELRSRYLLSIRAKVGTVRLLSASSVINVAVLDKNDVTPKFASSSIEVKVDENWAVGREIYQAVAVDKDLGTNGLVHYQLSVDAEGKFRINSTSGVISLAKKLSQNGDLSYALHVLATDHGSPPLYSSLVVNVLIGTNHPPQFSSSSYTTRIPANMPHSYRFYPISAMDRDTGQNGKIVYSILAGNEEGLFGIFPDGMMFVKKSLQRAIKGSYTVTIAATDNGNPPLKASVPLTIFIEDSNEHRTLFTNNTFRFSIAENKPAQSFVGRLRANASNPSRTSDIRFLLTSNSPEFHVNDISGEIRTTRNLDREQLRAHTSRSDYILQVEAQYNDTTLKKDRAIVIIKIIDENDNAPSFSEQVYHITASENLQPGAVVYRVIAFDPDEGKNGDFIFSLTGGTGVDIFSIEPKTGDLILNDTIDRETVSSYNLTVKCTDLTNVSMFSNAVIQLTVGDVNDNTPEFEKDKYIANVSEAQKDGSTVTVVSATDKDSGSNAQIVYTIVSGNLDAMFIIDHATGVVTLARNLDFEAKSNYFLNITAEDRGSPRRMAVTQLVINVLDINDNAPVFDREPLNISIPENVTVGTEIGHCSASDKDSGENAKIVYRLLPHDSVEKTFTVDSATCAVGVIGKIDFEMFRHYQLTIQASDLAVPISSRLSSTKVITVEIVDINDNRPRFVSAPAVAVHDGTSVGTTIITLSAEDSDAGDNGHVGYQLLSGNSAVFELDGSSGAIKIKSQLSRLLYQLTVQASDNGNPPQTSSSAVTIFRRSSGGGGPAFTKSLYNETLPENSKFGTTVVRVSASGSGIKYYITKDNSGSSFRLNANTGEITTIAVIDREGPSGSRFELDIYAVDTQGTRPSTTRAQVLVNILDENDNTPKFSKHLYTEHVTENALAGTTVGRVHAIDPDMGRNGEIQFEITGGNKGNKFRIDKDSGYINTREVLDREGAPVYYLNVTGNDLGSSPRSSSCIVEIIVADENDNKPVFAKSFYTFSVFEGSEVGTRVGSVVAVDYDEGSNAHLSYYIQGNDGHTFEVEPSTGILKLAQAVDHEKVPHYILTLGATDGGTLALNSTVPVYVNVLDRNDNHPRFLYQRYEAEVSEDVALHSSITTVAAVDSDSGINGKIKYAISSKSGASVFSILANGTVVNIKKLDREVMGTYTMEVLATDQAMSVSDRLTGKTWLVINVTDVNDNRPYFTSSNVTHVSEHARIGDTVASMIVVDRDMGINSEIIFSLRKVDSTAPFSLGQSDGILRVTGPLDHETKAKYIVYVTAADRGSPALSAQMELQIVVDDYNDHTPVFQQHPDAIQVLENVTIGSVLLRFTARDGDEGRNAEVKYGIVKGNDHNVFEIGSTSGVLQTRLPLDREQKARYNLEIRASDQGIPEKFVSTTVSVVLRDINDQVPRFKQAVFVAYVNESTLVQNVITVVATDSDVGVGGDISYSIVSGGLGGVFSIGPKTGIISLNTPLDREKQAELQVRVRAQDASISSMFSETEIIVKVQDENDNSPIFIPNKLQASVLENSPENTFVIQVNATDPDEGDNAKLTYTLVNSYGRFKIDSSNGVIVATVSLDREQVSVYPLQVRVTDAGKPPREGSALVNVIVKDQNDHDPAFEQSSYEATVSAGAVTGTFILVTSALDQDAGDNAQSEYSVIAGGTPVFHIGSTTGIITVASTVPHSPSSYSLTIKATNRNAPRHSATTSVKVVVITQGFFPTFLHGDQELRISELVAVGTNLLTVNATGHLVYFIAAGNEGDVFSVDKVHGILSVAKPLDFEFKHNFTVVIGAKDSSAPVRAGYVTVCIHLIDENDNAPVFSQQIFYVSVPEELPPPTNVTHMHATDADSGSNADLEYSILQSTPVSGYFGIDESSGWLFTHVKLDREKIASYRLKVQAVNVGKKSLKSDAIVMVTVSDVNDHAPVFENHPIVTVPENASVGSVVATVRANDADEGLNAQVQYLIMQDSSQESYFAINSFSGELTLVRSLNREKNASFLLKIVANDSVYVTVMSLKVDVLDVNDNPPEFLEDPYSRDVDELLPVGTPVLNITARDKDSGLNSRIAYSLLPSQHNDKFEINSWTGVISVTRVLKYESPAQVNPNVYNLLVEARNVYSPFQTSNASVVIQIVDVNDHAPVFTKSTYQALVTVPSPRGTSVTRVIAEDDKDFGANAVVRYMAVSGNGTMRFAVAADTGVIYPQSSLPQSDASQVFYVRVRAVDQGNPSRESFADVYIEAVDKNEHVPVFTNSGNVYEKIISENMKVGGSIMKVSAVDADSGTNGEVSYALVGGNSAGFFGVGTKNGTIYAAKALDFEFDGQYELNVTAKDGGKISRSSFVRVKITLTDFNNNHPVFRPRIYRPQLPENSKLGSYICTVTATDKDGPGNNQVSFALNGGDQKDFSIDSHSGVVSSKAVFDYEGKRSYFLSVSATDSGSPSLVSSPQAEVYVEITGVNEFVPKFTKKHYLATIAENAPVGLSVTQVSAVDNDEGPDGIVAYYLPGSSNDHGFKLDPLTGVLSVSGKLDSETASLVTLRVIAKNLLQSVISFNTSDLATIVVNVTDANDAPRFIQSEYRVRVSEGAGVGSFVANITAVDDDPDAGDVTYGILNGNIQSAFSVDPKTGIVRTAAKLDRETISSYRITMTARDTGRPPMTGTTLLIVSLEDLNDNPPHLVSNCTGLILENKPSGSGVSTLKPVDRDVDPNRGPFSFALDGTDYGKFSVDASLGIITTKAILDREERASYKLSFKIYDNGSPKLWAVSSCTVIVGDENDNPPENSTRDVIVNLYNGKFVGGVISNVEPADKDTSNSMSCQLSNSINGRFSFARDSCLLHSTQFTGQAGLFALQVTGSDGKQTVAYEVNVKFLEYTQMTVAKSIAIRLQNVQPQEFLEKFYKSFVNAIAGFLTPGYKPQLFSVKTGSQVSVDVLVALHEENTAMYMEQAHVADLFVRNKAQLEGSSGVRVKTIDYTPCSDYNPCRNGGECFSNLHPLGTEDVVMSVPVIFRSANYEWKDGCRCKAGFGGEKCEENVNDCKPNPCRNGGTCQDKIPGYTCACTTGFKDLHCLTDIDECLDNPCKAGGTCSNSYGSYDCTCKQGYTGKNCETDVDYCASNPCMYNSTCSDLETSYKCQCDFGGRGSQCQVSSLGFGLVSYMLLPTIQSSKRGTYNNITLEFATTSRSGLLLYNRDHSVDAYNPPDFIALEIVDGKVRLLFNLGDGKVTVESDKFVSDGSWHHVSVIRDKMVSD